MQTYNDVGKQNKLSFFKKLRKKTLLWLRLTNDPVIKVYNGYGNSEKLIIFGHILFLSPLPRKKYRKNIFNNSYSLLRSFMVRIWPCATIRLTWDGTIYETQSEDDGFFRFEWCPKRAVAPGKHSVQLILYNKSGDSIAETVGHVFVPDEYKYAIISDIDDTFLVSHSSNLRKRLYVLLTKNAHSRKPFEGVVKHYRLLANAGMQTGVTNPFFYVSSSEWNLYDFLRDFRIKQELPEGIFLLSQIKKFREVFKTGQGKHTAKFFRIARIVEAYPHQPLILLGDDSQQDPAIYLSIAEHFPGKVSAVYIRQTFKKNYEAVKLIIEKIQKTGVPCCYFQHSSEAVIHSKKIGLIVDA